MIKNNITVSIFFFLKPINKISAKISVSRAFKLNATPVFITFFSGSSCFPEKKIKSVNKVISVKILRRISVIPAGNIDGMKKLAMANTNLKHTAKRIPHRKYLK